MHVTGSSPPPRTEQRVLITVLGVVLAVGVALRVIEALRTPLWFDEVYVLFLARLAWVPMLHQVGSDIHPPLGFALVHVWRALGGEGQTWLKLLPILASIVGVVGTFALARRIRDPIAGVIAAALVALHFAHIHYSQQLESYSILWGLLPWLLLAAWNLVDRARPSFGARSGLTYTVLALACMYVDYMGGFLVATCAAWGVIALRSDRTRLKRWIVTHLAILALYAPQAVIEWEQFTREARGGHRFGLPTGSDLLRLVELVGFGPLWGVAIVLALASIAVFDTRTRKPATLMLALLTIPLWTTQVWPFVMRRDMLFILPLVYVLVGCGIMAIRWRPARFALLSIPLLLAGRRLIEYQPWAEPLALERAEKVLERSTTPGEVIVSAEPHALLFFEYHMPGLRHRLLMPAGEKVPYSDAGLTIPDSLYWTDADLARFVARHSPWWGVRVDRAFVKAGVPLRAGAWAAGALDSVAPQDSLEVAPVTLWHGGAGS